ncbi:DUF1493 family protein [Flavobacterium sp.]|jgi:acyl carrier protein|uniref:DUF1493 family protein n=1 Tax=Flavobacterium sp. TaxID=239 RepID=UPI00286F0DE3|nr:DUF1493 family protein [Flavobacterium sp.]
MNEETFNKLKEFIINQSAVNDEEINSSTRIEDDLGVSGDDAVEFIIAFGKEFNVDISKFMANDYFSPEGDFILPALIRFLTNKKKRDKKSFTVGHLEKAIIAGKLDENTFL